VVASVCHRSSVAGKAESPNSGNAGQCRIYARISCRVLPAGVSAQRARPMRSEIRAALIASIARGRRWLREIVDDANAKIENIATRENCSVRQVNMTISLAFLAPDIVKVAIDGRLPRGIGVTRLRDAPIEVAPACNARPALGFSIQILRFF
jgi:hypothetical protein